MPAEVRVLCAARPCVGANAIYHGRPRAEGHRSTRGALSLRWRHTRRRDPSRRAVRSFVRLLSRSVGMEPTRVPSCAILRARVGRPVTVWQPSPPAAPGCPGIDRLPSLSHGSANRITPRPTIYVGARSFHCRRRCVDAAAGSSIRLVESSSAPPPAAVRQVEGDPSPSNLEQRPADGVSGCPWAAHNPHAARRHANPAATRKKGHVRAQSTSWTGPRNKLPARARVRAGASPATVALGCLVRRPCRGRPGRERAEHPAPGDAHRFRHGIFKRQFALSAETHASLEVSPTLPPPFTLCGGRLVFFPDAGLYSESSSETKRPVLRLVSVPVG